MKWLKLLFGGSFGTVQAVLLFSAVSFAGYAWVKYHDTMEDNKKLEAQALLDRAALKSKDSTINTLSGMAARREDSNKDGQDAKDTINSVPDSTFCGRSEPMWAGVDWLREYRQKRGEAVDVDQGDVPMPTEAEIAERDITGQRVRRILNGE